MQLYHHPYSIDSQRVRLALEEKGIDYTSHHVNPVTGKNMDSWFFKISPRGKIPVFQNGSHILFDTIEIIQYIERISVVSSGADEASFSSKEVIDWMQKIKEWNSKYFTLSHIPEKYRNAVSKFLRRVAIDRMAEAPDLASTYRSKLKEAYETEDKMKKPEFSKRSEEHLVRLLDEIESKLKETTYVAGEDFSMGDVMLIPVLARLVLLDMEEEYIKCRPNVAEYWIIVQERGSYKKVIGRYFKGWKRYRTIWKTWCFVRIRTLLRKY